MENMCPGCGRHCYLDEAKCERGVEFARNGIMPPRKPHPDGDHARRNHSEQKMKYLSMTRDEKIICCLEEMGRFVSEIKEPAAEGLLSALREDDIAKLLMLLEKLRHDWRHKAKQDG